MGETYYSDCSGGQCDPDAVVTQMQEERGKFSHDISQEIQSCSNILKMAEATKRQFPSGMGDTVKSMVLDIAQPSTRDVLDHQKRLASARPGNSPCEIPRAKIPYGSHTVEACLFGWAWETDFFCKTDLAFKYKREKQQQQIKNIMTTWSSGIWNAWVWRAYQRSVSNWVLNANIPRQHGAAGYAKENPTSILTVAWLDTITLRLRDASGLVGSPTKGSWAILIGEEECKTLFDEYYKTGAEDYGVRKNSPMEGHKRYDQDLMGGCEYYELNNYKFFVECHTPRYRDRVGNESWDDALLDTRIQTPAQFGTESAVPAGYRDPDTAKYSEILIFNTEAVNWLTPPAGMTQDNGFHQDAEPGYSYAGDFIPLTPPQIEDPLGKNVKYYAEFVAGMESIFPNRGASILALACHISPALKTINYTLTPTKALDNLVTVQASMPILPMGTLQIQTRDALPNFADGYALFLITAGDRKVKVATATSEYCTDMGYWLHALTFTNADAGACVPRDCDQWKKVEVLAEGTAEDTLIDEDGCAVCTSYGAAAATAAPACVSYVGDNIASVTVGSTVIEGTVAATLEAAVQAHLDGLTDGGTVTITEGVAGNNYTWSVCIEDGVTDFSVEAIIDGGGLGSFHNDPATEGSASAGAATVFSVADNEAVGGFATYAGDYYDSGENTTADSTPVWTNGTTFAAHDNAAWDGAVMVYYASLADAQGAASATYDSVSAGVSAVEVISTSTVVGVQS